MYDEFITITENRKVNGEYLKLAFRSRRLSRAVKPGQFMNIQLEPGLDPFLRRPFSYYRVEGDRVEVLYEILGRGTALLSGKKKGDVLRVLGPLGRPFTKKVRGKKRVLVAGGVGVPPLIFLAETTPMDFLLIGTKTKDEVLPRKEISRIKAKVLYSTNDGSYGMKGFVTALLEKVLKEVSPSDVFIQTCGPNVMMQAVMDMAHDFGVEGEASIDRPMACGVGVCLGCMVKTPSGWRPSCTEGPVFGFHEVERI